MKGKESVSQPAAQTASKPIKKMTNWRRLNLTQEESREPRVYILI